MLLTEAPVLFCDILILADVLKLTSFALQLCKKYDGVS